MPTDPLRHAATAAILVALLLPASADPVPVPHGGGSWIIGEDVTFADGTYTVTEPITIGPGGSLVIRDSDVTLATDPLCAEVDRSRICTGHITILPGGHLDIRRSTIVGVVPDGDLEARISSTGGTIHIDNTTLTDLYGIDVAEPGGQLWLADSGLTSVRWGAEVLHSATGTIQNNSFTGSHRGTRAQDATASIRDNVFTDITFPVDIQQSVIGSKIHTTRVDVQDNIMTYEGDHEAPHGIFTDSQMGGIIAGNQIRGFREGIVLRFQTTDYYPVHYRNPPTVESNQLTDNLFDIVVDSLNSNQPRLPLHAQVIGNELGAGSCVNLLVEARAATTIMVVATDNSWRGFDAPSPLGPDGCGGIQTIGDATVTLA